MSGSSRAYASPLEGLRELAPGIAFVLALAGLAMIVARWLSNGMTTIGTALSPALLAVLLGLVWRNCAGVPDWCEQGLQWAAQVLLRLGVALLGLRLSMAGAGEIALTAAPIIAMALLTALIVGWLISRALGLESRLAQLLVVGTAICGCSAVMALAPAIRAKSAETGFAVATVVLFGTLGMLLYPWIAAETFGQSALHAGVFLGTAIHDTSQVVGAALMYSQNVESPEVLTAAVATKLLRNVAIVVLVPLAAWRAGTSWQQQTSRWHHVLPTFVLWFLFFVMLRSVGDGLFMDQEPTPLWVDFVSFAQQGSELALIAAMTAVGLSVSLSELQRLGWRPMVAGFVVALAVGICCFCLTVLSNALAH